MSPTSSSLPHPLLASLFAPGLGPLRRFARALRLPLRAAAFLARTPRLWPFIVIPALINIVLFGIGVAVVLTNVDALLGWMWVRPVGEGAVVYLLVGLWYLMRALIVIVGLVISYIFVLLVGGILGSPFNDALSERTEIMLTGRPAPETEGDFLGGIPRSIGSTAFITLIYLAVLLPILLLNLIPALGSVAATILGACLSAFFLSLEYADNTFERYGFSLKEKFRILRQNIALSGGVGLGTSLLLWIPLLNFLCIPIAVVSGTVLALGLVRSRDPQQGMISGQG